MGTGNTLQIEQSFLNAVFENTASLMIVLDHQGKIIRFNSSCEALTGYQAREVIGHFVWDFLLTADEIESVKEVFKQLAFEAIPNKHENYWLTRSGEKRLINWNNSIIRGSDNQVEYIISSGLDVTDRQAAEQALKESRASLLRAQQIARLGNWDWDIVGGGLSWSDEIYRIFGVSPQAFEATYETFLNYIHPDDRQEVIDAVNAAVFEGKPYSVEHRVVQPGGDIRFVHEQGVVYYDNAGKAVHMIGTVHDITERVKAEEQTLKLSQATEQTADSIIITDNKGIIEYVNPAFSEITGYSKEEVIGKTPALLKSGKHDDAFYRNIWQTLLGGKNYRNVIVNRRKDGSTYYEEVTISPLKSATGEVSNFISTGKDITEMMQTQERLYHQAHHDALTSLPNRVLLMDRLSHALARCQRESSKLSVLFLDLDQFKKINDTLGHNLGDKLLSMMADRLCDAVRAEDTVARLGGDEFAILLEDTKGSYAVRQVADKIIAAMNQPFNIGKHELFCTTSIGISIYPEDGDKAETLLMNADTAMYKAKDNGRNNYSFYSTEMHSRAFERLNLETNLRYALERNEFELHYQPLFNPVGEIEVFEVLLRWNHPQLGLVYPDDFIPLLEETGMITSVGEWVLRQACSQVKQWHNSGFGKVRVAVNFSSRQFGEHGLAGQVWKVLQQLKLPPEYLEIEITESTLMENAEHTLDTLLTLSQMGVKLALDDFGTGYSSLSYLKKYPINTIKIDRSFVKDLPDDKDDITLVKAIINLAKNLSLTCVAEGIETEAQLDFLKDCGCDLLQGYYFSEPLAPQSATDIIRSHQV